MTRELVHAGSMMQIKVLDHIIIGDNTYFSFPAEGLIGGYELDLLSLEARTASKARRRRLSKGRPSDIEPYCA